jgi:hypothetical protein
MTDYDGHRWHFGHPVRLAVAVTIPSGRETWIDDATATLFV